MFVYSRLIGVLGVLTLAAALPLVAQQPSPAATAAQPAPAPATPKAIYDPDVLAGEKGFVVGVQPPIVWGPLEDPAPKVPEGFTPIFNGKNLTGWHTSRTNMHGTAPNFQVINGMIIAMQVPLGMGGILLTDRSYHNFEFYMEVRPDYGCDSGVFVRSTEAGWAYQVTMDYVPGGSMGSLTLEPREGSVWRPAPAGAGGGRAAALAAGGQAAAGRAGGRGGPPVVGGIPLGSTTANGQAAWMKVWKREAWNSVRIRFEGDVPHVQVWINDQLITDTQEATNRANDGMTNGPLALQMHGGNRWVPGGVWRWRNIGIKELP